MCTLSFYKGINQVIITSNRDENRLRPNAIHPKKINLKNTTVYCPIDPQHNGTWFAANQKGDVFVLLNGAENKHISNPPYKKSRGLILLEIVDHENILENWQSIELKGIENFTLIVFVEKKLFHFTWNGSEKSCQKLNENKPYIWSSSTLYDDTTRRKREDEFNSLIAKNKHSISSDDLINFHTMTEMENNSEGIIINRTSNILTKNITQITLKSNSFKLHHWDLIDDNQSSLQIDFA